MHKKMLLILLLSLIFAGCIMNYFDKEAPTIVLKNKNIIKIKEGEYNLPYKDGIVKIEGSVKDNDKVKYLKENDINVELKNGEFTLYIDTTKIQKITLIAEDERGNKKNIKINLIKDDSSPKVSKLKINDKDYIDNMIVGGNNNKIKIELNATDESGIKEVSLEEQTFTKGTDSYTLNYENIKSGDNVLSINVVDEVGNVTTSAIKFYYDKVPPSYHKIYCDDTEVNLGEEYITNKSKVTLKFELEDVSDIINLNYLSVNDIQIDKSKFINQQVTVDVKNGSNVIKFSFLDEFGNVTEEKNIKIYNSITKPKMDNIKILESSIEVLPKDDIYYVNSPNISITGELKTEDVHLNLSYFKLNSENADWDKSSGDFNLDYILSEPKKDEIIKLEVGDNAGNQESVEKNIYYDNTKPIVTFDNEYNDKIWIKSKEDAINLSGKVEDDNFEKLLIENSEITVDSSTNRFTKDITTTKSSIYYEVSDKAGNILTGEKMVSLDAESPTVKSLTINGKLYADDMIVNLKDNKNILIDVTLEDNVGIKDVKLGDKSPKEIKSNMRYIFEITSEEIKDSEFSGKLIFYDFAGNQNEKNILVRYYKESPIIKEIKLDNKDIVENKIEYSANGDVSLVIKIDSQNIKMKIDKFILKLNGEILYSKEESNGIYPIYLGKKNSNNDINIYLENENGLSEENNYEIYYDALPPITSEIKVYKKDSSNLIYSEINYTKNMNYPMDGDIYIDFKVTDDLEVESSEVNLKIGDNTINASPLEKGIYSVSITNNLLTQGLNKLDILSKDKAGNISIKTLYINFYKLLPIELSYGNLSQTALTLNWTGLYPGNNLLKYELYMEKEGDDENYERVYSGTKLYNVISGLDDDSIYKFYILGYDKYIKDSENKVQSNILEIKTLNKQPEKLTIYFGNVEKEIDTLQKYGIKIYWDKVSEIDRHDFLEYVIYRNDTGSDNENDYKEIATIKNANETYYKDEIGKENENKLYKYEVVVRDKGYKISDRSNGVSAYSYNLPPDIPTDFEMKFEEESSGSVYSYDSTKFYGSNDENNKVRMKIKINDVSTKIKDLQYYEVYRSISTSVDNTTVIYPSILIYRGKYNKTYYSNGSVDYSNNEINLIENGLNENSKYYYKIRAWDKDLDVNSVNDEDEYSETNIFTIKTCDLKPAKVKNIVGYVSGDFVSIWWEFPYIKDFSKYSVYRKENNSYVKLKDITDINEKYFSETDLDFDNNSLYNYKIEAYDSGNNSSEIIFTIDKDGGITVLN
ncbi:hypothetical protein [Haliovirga abyssi]|uniref:Fibronectin type III domain-containing protein n=1 Tax=Haliovirga abyssi TaxID=2996794 RepID=A0AAU9DBU1_9FUSO|nr:hypothetical protein [Haliovirga abyssi]BDU50755.1 hypothetical protein HLVA_13240 [Haliovirga abyssi]